VKSGRTLTLTDLGASSYVGSMLETHAREPLTVGVLCPACIGVSLPSKRRPAAPRGARWINVEVIPPAKQGMSCNVGLFVSKPSP
jgi:hypothetical protein